MAAPFRVIRVSVVVTIHIKILSKSLYSSIPPQYVGSSQTFHHDGSGDVVIVVPAMDGSQNMDEIIVGGLPEHSICIETEADIEPTSPKTMTESSSKF